MQIKATEVVVLGSGEWDIKDDKKKDEKGEPLVVHIPYLTVYDPGSGDTINLTCEDKALEGVEIDRRLEYELDLSPVVRSYNGKTTFKVRVKRLREAAQQGISARK
jgi:hypothetical protein